MGLPTATVRMRGPDGIARTSTGMGTGPVDAAYKAIDSLVRVQVGIQTLAAAAATVSLPEESSGNGFASGNGSLELRYWMWAIGGSKVS